MATKMAKIVGFRQNLQNKSGQNAQLFDQKWPLARKSGLLATFKNKSGQRILLIFDSFYLCFCV